MRMDKEVKLSDVQLIVPICVVDSICLAYLSCRVICEYLMMDEAMVTAITIRLKNKYVDQIR